MAWEVVDVKVPAVMHVRHITQVGGEKVQPFQIPGDAQTALQGIHADGNRPGLPGVNAEGG